MTQWSTSTTHTHTNIHTHTHTYIYRQQLWVIFKGFYKELFAQYFNLLIFYIELSIGFWFTRILKQEDPEFESFPPSANLALDYIYIYIYAYTKLATIVEGDPKAPFSIATTPRCRGGRYSIPWIAPLYPWTVPYNAEC